MLKFCSYIDWVMCQERTDATWLDKNENGQPREWPNSNGVIQYYRSLT